MTDNREEILQGMVKHGAEEVPVSELFERSDIVWQIGANESISKTCVRMEEFIASAARNAQHALQVIDRMQNSDGLRDKDLLTALKKYVEDTCEAIKVVDNSLKSNSSSLNTLFVEVPNNSKNEDISWRNLIGRRDVIAHELLSIDNAKVYREAVRDFGNLHQLLSRTYFVPVKTDLNSGQGFSPAIKGEAIKKLSPSEANRTPNIGESLIFVCDDKQLGFISLRLGRSEKNRALFASSQALSNFQFAVYAIDTGNVTLSKSESLRASTAD